MKLSGHNSPPVCKFTCLVWDEHELVGISVFWMRDVSCQTLDTPMSLLGTLSGTLGALSCFCLYWVFGPLDTTQRHNCNN